MRRYTCEKCERVVSAIWKETDGFSVGCDCTVLESVPEEMSQSDAPASWIVERRDCCSGVATTTLDPCYEEAGADFRCPDCGSTYRWDGKMMSEPDNDPRTLTPS